jgi:hypothetical protein
VIRLAQALLAGMLALAALPCAAGGGCREHVATPGELASAAGSAQRVLVELEARDQPLALLARHGTDLSEQACTTATSVSWSATMPTAAGPSCTCSTPAAATIPACTRRAW